ncbi:four-carbon acid sugar kinase family protein [Chitinasiproducens palmae]|uniref:Uncharacterized conserved protein YgbK, DUF1537 family n=1 Tax=Chitinasiproducens palmae TaxID=1770053 RepID=A0A1H2PU82_9BURK|nr:four-carbon acid sugar kinase family protein [Chitinasiproducens palmae]SDV50352.1 Uncharacterized conserved protein YgbK, DUF1537 family [Chitinasiproducens palmae]
MNGARPLHAFYGDDFTGATDTLATLAQHGWRTVLFLDAPSAEHLARAGELDAIGVAGTARALPPDAITREVDRVGQRLAEIGARTLHYKVCSTFDSAPATGSIGAAVAALRRHFPNPVVPIVGGQPNLRRFCVFGNLFAAAGTPPGIHRIDRHPTMSRHPVTPMHEADLRRHLAAQGLAPIALIDWLAQQQGKLQAQVEAALADGAQAVLFDVLDDTVLPHIGTLIDTLAERTPLLAVGASSVAQALVQARGALPATAQPDAPPPGAIRPRSTLPVFALAGSLSPLTEQQIAAARHYEKIELSPAAMTRDRAYLETSAAHIGRALDAGRSVLAYTERPGSGGATVSESLAPACADLLAQVLELAPVRRVVVAGGDTSSYAVKRLDVWGLSYVARVGAGVAMCRLHADRPHLDGLEIVLKGGQMGEPGFFDQAAAAS